MTPQEAKEITLEVWRYLVANPDIKIKKLLPSELYSKINSFKGYCPLCELYDKHKYRNIIREHPKCPGCPLSNAGQCCYLNTSVYHIFIYTVNEEAARDAARKLVKIVEEWETV